VGAGTLLLALGFVAGYLVQPDPSVPAPQLAAAPAKAAAHDAAANDAAPSAPPGAGAPSTPPAAPAEEPGSTAPELAHTPAAPLAAPTSASDERPRSGPPRAGITRRANGPETRAPSDELSLLERAERAVRAHNPDLALALARELERRHPRSALHEERRAIELMALCQSGSSRAHGLGQHFVQRYPESVYAERITTECGATPTIRSSTDIDGSEGGIHAEPDTQ
jgi:hypothetical protein